MVDQTILEISNTVHDLADLIDDIDTSCSDAEIQTWSGRSQQEKNKDSLNIKDYGAKVDGVSDDTAAISAMYSDVGFIKFPSGITKLTTSTLLGHVYFDDNATLLIDSGTTLTINAYIHASEKQTIFTGAGQYNLSHVNASGESYEDVRNVYAAWFGVYPSNDYTTDQAPAIQKISDSLGNAREGIVRFMAGNYHLKSPVLWNRGIEVCGEGTRRTVFKLSTDGFIPFSTNGVAVRFSGFQFEFEQSVMTSRTSSLISIQHNDCEIYDVGIYPSAQAIVINAVNAVVKDIRVTWGTDLSTVQNSAAIVVNKGNCLIDGIRALTSAYAPQYLILVIPSNSNVAGINISNIQSIIPCTNIGIISNNYSVTNLNISDIQYNNSSTVGVVDSIIKLVASGTGVLRGVNINNVISNGTTVDGILLNAISGNIQSINIDNVTDTRTTGYPVSMKRTSGIISKVLIGKIAAHNVTQIVAVSGNSISYKLSNLSETNITHPRTYDFSLNDDAVYTIPVSASLFASNLIFSAGGSSNMYYGSAVARVASLPNVTGISSSTNVVYTTTLLTGTTGTNGNITVSIQDGQIQFENRTGITLRCSFTIMSGTLLH